MRLISEKGKSIDQDQVEVLENLPQPISVKGVRCFVGHAVFYRSFIKDFFNYAHPLCKLLEKECKFYFDESYQKLLGEFKEKLCSHPLLFYQIRVRHLR